WALLIGRGFAALWESVSGRRWVHGGLVALVLAQGYGVVAMHPLGLSYYNLLVGGLPGAERLGLELTYWGDAVDRELQTRLAKLARPNDKAALAPTLVARQGPMSTSRILADRPVALQDQEALDTAEWVVVYRRIAYWRPEIREITGQ